MNEPKCPKCRKPLSFELGTYYCHSCRLIIDPSALEPPMTNADRIRAMTDKELAEYLVYHNPYSTITNCMNWLQQPAKEE